MAKYNTPAQWRAACERLRQEGGDQWAIVEAFILQKAEHIEKLEAAIRFLAAKCKAAGILDGAAAPAEAVGADGTAPAVPPFGNGTRIGADGQPLSPQQQAVEEAMDAAIAAGGGQVAPPPRQTPVQAATGTTSGRPLPPRGGVRVNPSAPPPSEPTGERIGADGTPITDPQQLAAEAAMDAALSQ